MSRNRKLVLLSGAVAAFVATLMATGVGPVIAEQARPVLVQIVNGNDQPVPTRDVRQPFSIFLRVESAVGTGFGCVDVPLPAGTVLIENIEMNFSFEPTDGILVVPASVGENARTAVGVHLAAVTQNLSRNRGLISHWEGSVRVRDGVSSTPGELFRSSEIPVELCAQDDTPDIARFGNAVVTGEILR